MTANWSWPIDVLVEDGDDAVAEGLLGERMSSETDRPTDDLLLRPMRCLRMLLEGRLSAEEIASSLEDAFGTSLSSDELRQVLRVLECLDWASPDAHDRWGCTPLGRELLQHSAAV